MDWRQILDDLRSIPGDAYVPVGVVLAALIGVFGVLSKTALDWWVARQTLAHQKALLTQQQDLVERKAVIERDAAELKAAHDRRLAEDKAKLDMGLLERKAALDREAADLKAVNDAKVAEERAKVELQLLAARVSHERVDEWRSAMVSAWAAVSDAIANHSNAIMAFCLSSVLSKKPPNPAPMDETSAALLTLIRKFGVYLPELEPALRSIALAHQQVRVGLELAGSPWAAFHLLLPLTSAVPHLVAACIRDSRRPTESELAGLERTWRTLNDYAATAGK